LFCDVYTGSGQFSGYDTYTYTHQGHFQYDDSNWVPRYEGTFLGLLLMFIKCNICSADFPFKDVL